jgi:hypothetical protein
MDQIWLDTIKQGCLLQGTNVGLHSYIILATVAEEGLKWEVWLLREQNGLLLYLLGVQITKHDSALGW